MEENGKCITITLRLIELNYLYNFFSHFQIFLSYEMRTLLLFY